jgi:hypothetical protein
VIISNPELNTELKQWQESLRGKGFGNAQVWLDEFNGSPSIVISPDPGRMNPVRIDKFQHRGDIYSAYGRVFSGAMELPENGKPTPFSPLEDLSMQVKAAIGYAAENWQSSGDAAWQDPSWFQKSFTNSFMALTSGYRAATSPLSSMPQYALDREASTRLVRSSSPNAKSLIQQYATRNSLIQAQDFGDISEPEEAKSNSMSLLSPKGIGNYTLSNWDYQNGQISFYSNKGQKALEGLKLPQRLKLDFRQRAEIQGREPIDSGRYGNFYSSTYRFINPGEQIGSGSAAASPEFLHLRGLGAESTHVQVIPRDMALTDLKLLRPGSYGPGKLALATLDATGQTVDAEATGAQFRTISDVGISLGYGKHVAEQTQNMLRVAEMADEQIDVNGTKYSAWELTNSLASLQRETKPFADALMPTLSRAYNKITGNDATFTFGGVSRGQTGIRFTQRLGYDNLANKLDSKIGNYYEQGLSEQLGAQHIDQAFGPDVIKQQRTFLASNILGVFASTDPRFAAAQAYVKQQLYDPIAKTDPSYTPKQFQEDVWGLPQEAISTTMQGMESLLPRDDYGNVIRTRAITMTPEYHGRISRVNQETLDTIAQVSPDLAASFADRSNGTNYAMIAAIQNRGGYDITSALAQETRGLFDPTDPSITPHAQAGIISDWLKNISPDGHDLSREMLTVRQGDKSYSVLPPSVMSQYAEHGGDFFNMWAGIFGPEKYAQYQDYQGRNLATPLEVTRAGRLEQYGGGLQAQDTDELRRGAETFRGTVGGTFSYTSADFVKDNEIIVGPEQVRMFAEQMGETPEEASLIQQKLTERLQDPNAKRLGMIGRGWPGVTDASALTLKYNENVISPTVSRAYQMAHVRDEDVDKSVFLGGFRWDKDKQDFAPLRGMGEFTRNSLPVSAQALTTLWAMGGDRNFSTRAQQLALAHIGNGAEPSVKSGMPLVRARDFTHGFGDISAYNPTIEGFGQKGQNPWAEARQEAIDFATSTGVPGLAKTVAAVTGPASILGRAVGRYNDVHQKMGIWNLQKMLQGALSDDNTINQAFPRYGETLRSTIRNEYGEDAANIASPAHLARESIRRIYQAPLDLIDPTLGSNGSAAQWVEHLGKLQYDATTSPNQRLQGLLTSMTNGGNGSEYVFDPETIGALFGRHGDTTHMQAISEAVTNYRSGDTNALNGLVSMEDSDNASGAQTLIETAQAYQFNEKIANGDVSQVGTDRYEIRSGRNGFIVGQNTIDRYKQLTNTPLYGQIAQMLGKKTKRGLGEFVRGLALSPSARRPMLRAQERLGLTKPFLKADSNGLMTEPADDTPTPPAGAANGPSPRVGNPTASGPTHGGGGSQYGGGSNRPPANNTPDDPFSDMPPDNGDPGVSSNTAAPSGAGNFNVNINSDTFERGIYRAVRDHLTEQAGPKWQGRATRPENVGTFENLVSQIGPNGEFDFESHAQELEGLGYRERGFFRNVSDYYSGKLRASNQRFSARNSAWGMYFREDADLGNPTRGRLRSIAVDMQNGESEYTTRFPSGEQSPSLSAGDKNSIDEFTAKVNEARDALKDNIANIREHTKTIGAAKEVWQKITQSQAGLVEARAQLPDSAATTAEGKAALSSSRRVQAGQNAYETMMRAELKDQGFPDQDINSVFSQSGGRSGKGVLNTLAGHLLSGMAEFQMARGYRATVQPIISAAQGYYQQELTAAGALYQSGGQGKLSDIQGYSARNTLADISTGFGRNANSFVSGITNLVGSGNGSGLGAGLVGTAATVLGPAAGTALIAGALGASAPVVGGLALAAVVGSLASYVSGAQSNPVAAVQYGTTKGASIWNDATGFFADQDYENRQAARKAWRDRQQGIPSGGSGSQQGMSLWENIAAGSSGGTFASPGLANIFGPSASVTYPTPEPYLDQKARDEKIAQANAEIAAKGKWAVSEMSPLAQQATLTGNIPNYIAQTYTIGLDTAKSLTSLVYGVTQGPEAQGALEYLSDVTSRGGDASQTLTNATRIARAMGNFSVAGGISRLSTQKKAGKTLSGQQLAQGATNMDVLGADNLRSTLISGGFSENQISNILSNWDESSGRTATTTDAAALQMVARAAQGDSTAITMGNASGMFNSGSPFANSTIASMKPMMDITTGFNLFERSMYGLNGYSMPSRTQIGSYFAGVSSQRAGALSSATTFQGIDTWARLGQSSIGQGYQQQIISAANGSSYGYGGIAGLETLSDSFQYSVQDRLYNAGQALQKKESQVQHAFTVNTEQPQQLISILMDYASKMGGTVNTDYMKKNGIPAYNAGAGSISWERQDLALQMASAAAQNSQQMTQYGWQLEDVNRQQSRQNIRNDWQRQSFALQGQQMAENIGFQNYQFQYQAGEMARQKQYYEEDYAYNQQVRQLQHNWQNQDYDQSIRRATGYERQQLIRERNRSNQLYNLETGQNEKEKDRQEESFTRQEEYFKKQVEHYQKITKIDQEQFALQKKQFEQEAKWRDEDFDIRRDRIKQEMGWTEQNYNRTMESYKIRQEQLDAEASAAETNYKLSTTRFEAQRQEELELYKLSQTWIGMTQQERDMVQTLNQSIQDMRLKEQDRLKQTFQMEVNFWNKILAALATATQTTFNPIDSGDTSDTTNSDSGVNGQSSPSLPIHDYPGPASAGQPYKIGTQEIFIPNTNGQIIPLGGASSGFTIQVTMPNGKVLAEAVMPHLPSAIKRNSRRSYSN